MDSKNIGEMFLVGFDGTHAAKDIEDLIIKYHIGGVILYSRNIQSIGQVAALCERLQGIRKKVSDTPLFIAIDQEGGVVQRIMDGVTVLPGNMAIGSVGEEDCAYAAGRITATELGFLGINVNFAPVLDISSNPDNPAIGVRSFGSDPDMVSKLGAAMINGLQEYGMIACAKHFPGKGNVTVDSHLDLPLNNSGKASIMGCELKPFAAAISSGVGMIMTAHVMYPGLSENKILPATMSFNILTKILRGEMGFKGVVVTDDMEMGAVTKYFTLDESVIKTVEAGSDIVMLCHTLSKQKEAFIVLEKAAREGKIKEERIEESLSRIRDLKKRITAKRSHLDVTRNTIPYHHLISDRMARDSITVVRNEKGILPLFLAPEERLLVIVPRYEALTQVEGKEAEEDIIAQELKNRHRHTTVHRIDLFPGLKDLSVLEDLDRYNRIVLFTYNAHLNEKQLAFAKKVIQKRSDAVIACIRNPYDISKLPEAGAAVATYGFRNCSIKALVEVLFGEIEAKGKMPVVLQKNVNNY